MKTNTRSKLFLIFGLIVALVLATVLVIGLCERNETTAFAQTETVATADETTEQAPAADTAVAADEAQDSTSGKAIAAGIAIGLPPLQALSAWHCHCEDQRIHCTSA